jgi:hypothetical protein
VCLPILITPVCCARILHHPCRARATNDIDIERNTAPPAGQRSPSHLSDSGHRNDRFRDLTRTGPPARRPGDLAGNGHGVRASLTRLTASRFL